MNKEKIIQICAVQDNPNPMILTNEGRVFVVSFRNPAYPQWEDITPDLSNLLKD